jgi:hypothetical protein
MLHEFCLYRSGWAYPQMEWPDNQIFAKRKFQLQVNCLSSIELHSMFGPNNMIYRVTFQQLLAGPIAGWWDAIVTVTVNHDAIIQYLPLSWYTGNPSDWHTGMVRGEEVHGIVPPVTTHEISERERALYALARNYPRGVWTLTARRAE